MQEMTNEICNRTTEGVEKQLKDTRDGQLYWVGRMLDGRCWMLQNLALDITTAGLKTTDTDINTDWTTGRTYLPTATQSVATGNKDDTAVQSWNFGKWVLATPLLTSACSNSTSNNGSISNCTKTGFVNVSNTTNFKATYTATTRSWEGANSNSNTLVAVNCTAWSGSGTSKVCTAGTYDAHYLVGNYYSWNAATAGTGGTIKSDDASGSICPKGWELPYVIPSGYLVPFGAKDFGDLLAAYGVASKLSGTGTDGNTYNIAGVPLRFVRGGYVSVGNGYVNLASNAGYYWSSTAYSNTSNAYRLAFGTSTTNGSSNGSRRDGYSVRCVAEYTPETRPVPPIVTN